GIDDVEAVLGHGLVHALPERGGRRRLDRDAALLLLLPPVHRRGAVVHLADLVALAGVEQDALRRRGLAGVDVRHDAEVAVAFDGGRAGHGIASDSMRWEVRAMVRGTVAKDSLQWPNAAWRRHLGIACGRAAKW